MLRHLLDYICDAVFGRDTDVLDPHWCDERTAELDGEPTGRTFVWLTTPDNRAHDSLRVVEPHADGVIIDGTLVPKDALRAWAREYVEHTALKSRKA